MGVVDVCGDMYCTWCCSTDLSYFVRCFYDSCTSRHANDTFQYDAVHYTTSTKYILKMYLSRQTTSGSIYWRVIVLHCVTSYRCLYFSSLSLSLLDTTFISTPIFHYYSEYDIILNLIQVMWCGSRYAGIIGVFGSISLYFFQCYKAMPLRMIHELNLT